ncbi:MAG TPA: hypothetical protein VN317_08085 [Candidatus Methanoperedens sp.]|nr:hypothetical protein [Candidatus Methanoperedens sp.]
MNRLYLHVGTHKTGTTALQQFFAGNRSRLSQLGVLYPDAGSPHHARLAAALRSGDRQPLLDVLASPEAARHPAVLLSSEDFERQAAALDFLRALAPCVTIVIYLRRQDFYVQSSYQASVKSPYRRSSQTFAQFYAECAAGALGGAPRRLDWLALVESWSAVFDRENVVVRPYERGQFAGGSIFADFLGVLGLALDEGFALPPPERSNPGFSREIVELLRLSNELRGVEQQAQLVQLMNECAASDVAAVATRTYDYLSPAQRVELLGRVEEGNRRIAREYLGREDGRLFLEPWPDPAAPWQEQDSDLQRVAPPLVGLIAHLHHETLELASQLRQAENRLVLLEGTPRRAGRGRWLALLSPLALWRRWRDARIVAAGGLVDAAFYRAAYPDVARSGADPVSHYVGHGWLEGRNPSKTFNTRRYLAAHPEVAATGRCPLVFVTKRTAPSGR